MAVVMYMEWDGVEPSQYDRVRELVDWEGNPADGGLLHVPWFADGGLRVVDIWESPEHFQRFQQERLAAGLQEAGVEGEPRVEINELHSRAFAPGIDRVTAG